MSVEDLDGRVHRRDRVRVFGPDIDVTRVSSHGVGGDDHALDQDEGVTLHQHAVCERAAVALVGVAADILAVSLGAENRLPLDPSREAGSTTAAKARLDDLVDDLS